MNKNSIKLKTSIIIVIFVFSTVFFLSFSMAVLPSSNSNASEDIGTDDSNGIETKELDEYIDQTEDTETESTGFYDGIGQSYDAETKDGITIKVFRYHAPGKSFNYGAQPVLLFPGLAMSMNVYLMHSIPDLENNFNITLPEDAAEWAIGDENIEKDPLLYYSLAYYLWKMGYDTWFGNYRGIGYGEMKSDFGGIKTTMDQYAVYDWRAAVRKVFEITGLHPVVGGHSTAGLTSIMYLHGTDFIWTGHLKSDDDLVDERNGITEGPETVAGFIGIDPAMIPVLPDMLDNLLFWAILATNLVIEAGPIIDTLTEIEIIKWLYKEALSIIFDEELIGEVLSNLLKIVGNMDPKNTNDITAYYFFKYGVSALPLRIFSQYADYELYDCCREYWKNGHLINGLRPPEPRPGDGYYYYTDHMDKIQVPALFLLADGEGEFFDYVDADQIIRDVVNGKTQHPMDEVHWIEAAHIDMGLGSRNPITQFTIISEWLAKI